MEADAMAKMPRLGDIYKEYVDKCFKAGAMDFDDLLLKTNELAYPFSRSAWQNIKIVSAIFWLMSTKIPTTASI